MLSKKGYNTEKLQVKLNRIELKDSFEPVEPLHETDLEGYLQHEHEMLLLTAIEEAKKEVRKARYHECKESVACFVTRVFRWQWMKL